MMRSLLVALLLATASVADEVDDALVELAGEVRGGLVRRGVVVALPALSGYAQGRLEKLFPEARSLATLWVDQAEVNAYSLPDGTVTIDIRLLLLIDNAAELDFVLAHEAAHVVLDHAAMRYRSDDWRVGDAAQLEMAADQLAYQRLQANGVNVGAAVALLRRLHTKSVVWADTHPGIAHRLQQAPPPQPGNGGNDGFFQIVAAGRIQALASLLRRGRWEVAADYATRLGDTLPAARRHWALAEAARLSGQRQRLPETIQGYHQALESDGDFEPAWRGLALSLDQAGRCAEADSIWRRLAAASGRPDAALIAHRLSRSCAGPTVTSDRASGTQPRPAPTGRPYRAAAGLSLQLPPEWVIVTASKDHVVLSWLGPDVHKIHCRWRTEVAPVPSLPAWLETAPLRLARHYPGRRFQLVDSAPIDDGRRWGLRSSWSDRDAAGLQWGTRAYWLQLGDYQVEIIHRAPRLYYYERDAATVAALVESIVRSFD